MKTLLLFLIGAACLGAQVRLPGPGGASSVGACTPAAGYSHCRILTIDYTQTGGSGLTNFGVLVSTALGSSRIQSSNCYDAIFTSDAGGTTKIPWEMETCTQATGLILAWVGLSSVSASANTLFYVSYDNSSISTAQNTGSYAPSNVWDSTFQGIWHLSNGTTLTAIDSSTSGNNGTITGATATTGQIDGGANFVASNSPEIALGSISAMAGVTYATLSAWFQRSSPGATVVLGKDNADYRFQVLASPDGNVYVSAENGAVTSGSFASNDTNWHQIAMVFNGSLSGNSARLVAYLDGVQQSMSFSGTIPATLGSATPVNIGYGSGNYSTGNIDEMRVSSGASLSASRLAGWVTAEYNNEKSGSTFVTAGVESGSGTGGGYQHEYTVTLGAAGQIPASQSNFTVLVCDNLQLGNGSACPTATGLKTTANGGYVTNSNGYDIVFSTTTCSSPTLMKWEMATYSGSSGAMEAWVLIPSLSVGGSNQPFYVCTGNNAISTFQGGSTGSTWSSNRKLVLHMPNGSSLSVADSTGNTTPVNHGATAASGQIDGGAGLNGTSQYIDVPVTINYATASIEAWLYCNGTGATYAHTISNANTNGSNNGLDLLFNTGYGVRFQVGTGSTYTYAGGAASCSGSYHVVGTYDGTYARVYVNGSLSGTSASTSGPIAASGYDLYIGQTPGYGGQFFGGIADEVRIDNSALSANWIATEYNNQSSPSSFMTVTLVY